MMSDLQTYLNNNDAEGRIIAISRGGTHSEIASFRDELGITFAIAADEQAEIYYKYATMYVPRCYVVDSNGMVRLMTYEYQSGDVEKLMSELKKLY
jgi:peroxiredoxin